MRCSARTLQTRWGGRTPRMGRASPGMGGRSAPRPPFQTCPHAPPGHERDRRACARRRQRRRRQLCRLPRRPARHPVTRGQGRLLCRDLLSRGRGHGNPCHRRRRLGVRRRGSGGRHQPDRHRPAGLPDRARLRAGAARAGPPRPLHDRHRELRNAPDTGPVRGQPRGQDGPPDHGRRGDGIGGRGDHPRGFPGVRARASLLRQHRGISDRADHHRVPAAGWTPPPPAPTRSKPAATRTASAATSSAPATKPSWRWTWRATASGSRRRPWPFSPPACAPQAG